MSHISEVDNIYLPILLDRKIERDSKVFKDLVQTYSEKIIIDRFSSQKKELFKIQNPRRRLSQAELDAFYSDWEKQKDVAVEGLWVYYPWSQKLIHILEKQEFIQLRTSRNQYKISKEEQDLLIEKKIGIIGLSVGSAVALSIATERTCGKLKLADYDTIELSNLNRLKTGIHNIGLNKCVVTAREIAEIDPFIQIECYQEGITTDNISAFLTEGGKLDILVDECDDIEIKILCRTLAKEIKIPVVMETSDRGMLDIERFDLEHDLAIFHGLLDGIPQSKLVNISAQDRVPLVMRIVDVMKSSSRARLSLLEIGQSINTWPQLASAVTLGGAVVTDSCRRMLLGQLTGSGRFYVDLEEFISNAGKPPTVSDPYVEPQSFNLNQAIRIADSLFYERNAFVPDEEDIKKIVDAGSRAPSSGNDQPWKWIFRNGHLLLFHDRSRSFSFSNFNDRASSIALGAAYENAILKSQELGFQVKSKFFPLPKEPDLVAEITFLPDDSPEADTVFAPELAGFIYSRATNRSKGMGLPLNDVDYSTLRSAAESIFGAKLHYITNPEDIDNMATVVGACDLIAMLNDHGHSDFFERDIHWSPEKSEIANDGIGIGSLGATASQLAALSMVRDRKVAQALRLIGGGSALTESTRDSIKSASCLAVLALPRDLEQNFFLGGIASQRFWLRAEQLGYAIQPLNAPLSLFARLDSGEGLGSDEIGKLKGLKKLFRGITNLDEKLDEIFLFKIARAESPIIRTKRLPLNEILFMVNDQI